MGKGDEETQADKGRGQADKAADPPGAEAATPKSTAPRTGARKRATPKRATPKSAVPKKATPKAGAAKSGGPRRNGSSVAKAVSPRPAKAAAKPAAKSATKPARSGGESPAAAELVRNMGTAPEPRRVGESTVAPGRVLGWAEFGHPDGDPVLWFHGTPGARKQVPPSVPLVALQRGFRVIGVERPGTGASTNHEYDRIVDFAADIEALADDLGLERFGVIGLSGGGPYTLAVCHELPDRVVAASILGGIGPTRGPDAVWSYTRVLRLLKPGLQAVRRPLGSVLGPVVDALQNVGDIGLEIFANIIGGSDKEVIRQPDFRAMFLEDLFGAGELRAMAHDMVLFSRHWGFQLADVRTPVIVWQGLADSIVPVSHGHHQAARLGNAKLRTRPGEGHFAGFSDAAAVLDALRETWADETAEPLA